VDTPTPDQLRADSDLLTDKLPDDNGGPHDLKLAARAELAAAVVASITGRQIDPIEEGVEVPPGMVSLAIHAVARMVERRIIQGAAQLAENTASGRLLRSFSAGPYSESYFAPGELTSKNGRPQMDGDPDLDDTLWALATDDARDEWIAWATGVQAPAGVISAFNYNRRGNAGVRDFGFIGGPDGV
jgi:hypothetical protein